MISKFLVDYCIKKKINYLAIYIDKIIFKINVILFFLFLLNLLFNWIYLFCKIICIKLYLQDVREEMLLGATITLSQSNRI